MAGSRFEPRLTINNAITPALAEIERARGFWEAAMNYCDKLRQRAVTSCDTQVWSMIMSPIECDKALLSPTNQDCKETHK